MIRNKQFKIMLLFSITPKYVHTSEQHASLLSQFNVKQINFYDPDRGRHVYLTAFVFSNYCKHPLLSVTEQNHS